MQFNVSQLLQEPIGSRRSFRLEGDPLEAGGQRTAVSGEVELLRTDGSILATARLSAPLAALCSDCAREFEKPLSLTFSEEFWPAYDQVTQARVDVPEGREGFRVVEGQLDLTEAVRQYIEMARPMRPHCGPNCLGIQTGPGSGGGAEPPDARWGALAALRRKLD